jgi:BlaI family transcriptional regulator, penicillinase repressor
MKTPGFSRLQLRIMQVLWERKKVTAREITDALSKLEPIAHSTVQTLLRRLEQRGAVAHEVDNNTFVYFPLAENKKVLKNSVQDLIDRLFNGSAHGMVSYLVSNRYVTSEELKELSEMPEKKRKGKP